MSCNSFHFILNIQILKPKQIANNQPIIILGCIIYRNCVIMKEGKKYGR